MKTCPVCKQTLPDMPEYWPNPERRLTFCKNCVNAMHREYRAKKKAQHALLKMTIPFHPERVYRGPTGRPLATVRVEGI